MSSSIIGPLGDPMQAEEASWMSSGERQAGSPLAANLLRNRTGRAMASWAMRCSGGSGDGVGPRDRRRRTSPQLLDQPRISPSVTPWDLSDLVRGKDMPSRRRLATTIQSAAATILHGGRNNKSRSMT